MTAARIVLLLVGVAGAVLPPPRLPRFVAPVLCSVVGLASGVLALHRASGALQALAAPVGFLLAAIPLAVLLDRFGYFEQLAELFSRTTYLVPGLWVLAAGTVAVLNLDAGVVLLTPLYLRVAARQDRPRRYLAFQPVLLALLASSFLPVSNLTNLIVEERFGLGPGVMLEHLALPGLAACVVGYFCYRKARRVVGDGESSQPSRPRLVSRDAHVLAAGSIVVGLVLVGFTVGAAFHVPEWAVALAGDGILVVLTREVPYRSVPIPTALVALSLGVLAAGATAGIDLWSVLGGTGPLAELRQVAVAALGANVVNNLPALLVSLRFVATPSHHASCSLWPVLFGVNAGPGLLVTGSLASLLWMDTMRRLGAPVSARQYLSMGLRVVLPAAAAGAALLIALSPAVGCG